MIRSFSRSYHCVLAFLFLPLLLTSVSSNANAETYAEIEWTQLMPQEDLAILLDPPDFMLGLVDGSAQDNLETLALKSESDEKAKRFNDALKSSTTLPEFDGRKIRIPGFIVPLDTDDDRNVTDFFIVPYFGACLHLPPPPPNQMLFGQWKKGIAVEDLSIPMWFEGTVYIDTNTNELGTSAYGLTVAAIEPYEG